MPKQKKTKVGIIGTGFVARGLSYELKGDKTLKISKILTRRKINQISNLAIEKEHITNSIDDLIEHSDLVVECSGDPIYATQVLARVIDTKIPVITMDSELQITSGSWLAKKGFITEAEGDQPGSLAALYHDAIAMGFKPMVLGNIKGFLNHNPTKEEMIFWADRNGISLEQVTSFTDGTKLQIEQAFVANGLGAMIAKQSLIGAKCENYLDGAQILAKKAHELKNPISDYVLSPNSPAGVFIAAKHKRKQSSYLKYFKLGKGPYYILTRPFHLCHLEISKTIRQVVKEQKVLLNNSINPRISVATISKRKLKKGEKIKRGIGSFDVRGEAINISDHPNHIPIGLFFDVVIRRNIDPNQLINFKDVEIPTSLALKAWQDTIA